MHCDVSDGVIVILVIFCIDCSSLASASLANCATHTHVITAGYKLSELRYLWELMEALRLSLLKDIRQKFRILVPTAV
jgi:hypothetical protein